MACLGFAARLVFALSLTAWPAGGARRSPMAMRAQIGLPFAAAPLAAASAPAPAIAAAPRAQDQLRVLAFMPQQAAVAVQGGDAVAFYQACLATGYRPPDNDDSLQRLLLEGSDR